MSDRPLKWTNEQIRAIGTTGCSLLVSAAAGSGKTAVLAERCAHLVCDAAEKCDIHELLVVTFTRAAADEMRNRIDRALSARLAAGDDLRLRRQLMLLERAHINTLHSFCTTVLRRHFNIAGIDPNFRMLDEEEAQLLRIETARELLDRRYDSDTNGRFQRFVDLYADGNDDLILKRVVRLHELLCSVVDPQAWMSRARNRIAEAQDKPLHQCTLGRAMISLTNRRLSDLEQRCVATAKLLHRLGIDDYAEHVNELRAAVEIWRSIFASDGLAAISAAIAGFEMPRLPPVPGDTTNKELAQKVVNALKKEIKEGAVAQSARFTPEQWIAGMRQILEPTEVLIDLVREFGKEYRAAKDEAGALDFSDLERMTLDVLRAPGQDATLLPSPAALAYHEQFKHVLVDEYQDINELQDAILTLVSRECVAGRNGSVSNLFCVGDVKQSIYRFRLADPRRFLSRDKQFRGGRAAGGTVIDLQSNFRSRAPLLGAINAAFERLMTLEAAEIPYDDSQRLKPALEFPPSKGNECFEGAPLELHLLPPIDSAGETPNDDDARELDRAEREAAFVARRIGEIMGLHGSPPMKVFDKSLDVEPRLRPIRFNDIVILLRSPRYKSEQFVSMLRAAGVPVHAEIGTGFFDSLEIRDMISLLSLLDNAQQDIALAAVLRSPLAALPQPEDGLARVRLAFPDGPFHLAARKYARNMRDELAAHLNDFFFDLDQWRELAHRRPLAEVLWQIYEQTGYLAFCAGLQDGSQRLANLIELHERARQFGSFQRQGLRRFMQFLESLKEEQDLGQPSTASEADDVVRIISIHGSKGLEFPVVIVPDLGKKHNLDDTKGAILVDREAGLGIACVDEVKSIRYPSLAWVIVQERIRRQSLAEELRVLYVAMTRAREHLILVGTCKPETVETWRQRFCDHAGALPPDDVLRGVCMLDWIGPAAAASMKLSPLPIEMILHDQQEIDQLIAPTENRPAPSQLQQQLAQLQPLAPPPADDPEADALVARLTRKYPHQWYAQQPAALTVGALTKTGKIAPGGESASRRGIIQFSPELPTPACVQATITPSPTEIGSATHLLLEHLDLSRSCSAGDVNEQIQRLVDSKIISGAMAAAIDLEAIAWLMTTPLGKLMRREAKSLRRELRICYPLAAPPPNLPASQLDPQDRIMIRGRVDALIPDGDGFVLVDYKTDHVTKETIDARAEFYRAQVEEYRQAVADITAMPVKTVHLVFLAAREIREIHSRS